jgi:hypothetical protein
VLHQTLVNVAVAGIFDNVAHIVQNTRRPVATVCANSVAKRWVAVCIKCQVFTCAQRCAWQSHVDGGRVGLWRLQCARQAFSVLLGEDGLLVHLIIDRVGEEVTTGHEVCRALNCAVANNGDLICTGWRCGQSDGPSAVGVDGHRVVGCQRQQRVVFVNSDVGVCKNLKAEAVRASAVGFIHNPASHIGNWHAHDSVLPIGNCTVLLWFVIEAIGFSQLIKLKNFCRQRWVFSLELALGSVHVL